MKKKQKGDYMIHSDWHIHSQYSYDAALPLESIAQAAQNGGFIRMGITDHLNFNDESFMEDLRNSASAVKEIQAKYPFMVLGVELTPLEKPEYDHIAKTGTREGYAPPVQDKPFDIELAATKEELMALGVKYAIGASHWRVDVPFAKKLEPDRDACIREWFRQQLYLACDERVTILGHPWYNGKGLWYEDFSVIPRSMNMELAAALKENGKYAEYNAHFARAPKATEKYRYQYAEFLREWFEMGIPITYGSDCHNQYTDMREESWKYLSAAGFAEGDIGELPDSAFY